MDAKFDPYEGFDPTLTEGGGCSCDGGVYWDMITQTWKQAPVATPKASADCSQVEAALKQAQADKAKADEKATKAEEAQASEATAIAKAEKAKEDLAAAQAELTTKQTELEAKDAEIAELKRKLEECQKDKCPEVNVISIGDETVFSGNSCDEIAGLSNDGGVPNEANDHL